MEKCIQNSIIFTWVDPPTLADVHNGAPILHVWNKVHEEQKMYINTMFAVIDVLVAELEDLDFYGSFMPGGKYLMMQASKKLNFGTCMKVRPSQEDA